MEITVSRDIRHFKTKDIGIFNFKEAGYLAAAIAVGAIACRNTGSIEPAILPIMIILVFGFFKPLGMSFYIFLKTVVRERLTPQLYINETDFVYKVEEIEKQYGKEVISKEWYIDTGPVKINKEDRKKIIW